jgi:hypothetical protein
MEAFRFSGRRRAATAPFAPNSGAVRRQVWVALLMGLTAIAALQSLWTSNALRADASPATRALPASEQRPPTTEADGAPIGSTPQAGAPARM